MRSLVDDELKSWQHYRDLIPLYLQNSHGFEEHFKILHDLLLGVGTASDGMLNLFDIFNEDFLEFIASLEDADIPDPVVEPSDRYGRKSDFLDKLAALFGVTRSFSVVVDGVTKDLTLNNYELLLLIKMQIVRNDFNGSYEQLKKFYSDAGMNVIAIEDPSVPASCSMYLVLTASDREYSQNVKDMWEAGLLFIKSMGISYVTDYYDLMHIMIWDSNNVNATWDVGRWL